MVEYERTVGGVKKSVLRGRRCERCGYIVLDNDDDVWSAI